MSQVIVRLNGRSYRMGCQEGEEEHLQNLARHLRHHVENLTKQFGQIGDDRILMMAGLMIADELWEMRRRVVELGGEVGNEETAHAERGDDLVGDEVG